MNTTRLNLVVLPIAAAVLLALAGCKRPAEVPAPATPPPAPAWSLDEGKLSADPLPRRRPRSSPERLQRLRRLRQRQVAGRQRDPGRSNVAGAHSTCCEERSLGVQQQLAERAAAMPAPTGIEKIVGGLLGHGHGRGARQCAGHRAARRIAWPRSMHSRTAPAVADYLRKVAAEGENPLFDFGAAGGLQELRDEHRLCHAGRPRPAGQDLLLRRGQEADPRGLREAHRQGARAVGRAGRPRRRRRRRPCSPSRHGSPSVSKSQEDLARDVSLYYNPMTPGRRGQADAEFPVDRVLRAQGIAAPEQFSLAMPAFHQEVSRMLADVPVAQWQSYLRYHLVDDASPYLSDAFVTEHFDFYDKTLAGQKEQRAALEARAGRDRRRRRARRWASSTSRWRFRRFEGAACSSWSDNLREALKARIENLTWMSDATKKQGARQVGHVHAEDRLSGQVARLDGPRDAARQLLSATCRRRGRSTTAGSSARSASRWTRPNGA